MLRKNNQDRLDLISKSQTRSFTNSQSRIFSEWESRAKKLQPINKDGYKDGPKELQGERYLLLRECW